MSRVTRFNSHIPFSRITFRLDDPDDVDDDFDAEDDPEEDADEEDEDETAWGDEESDEPEWQVAPTRPPARPH
jgi:hypothetical protein